MTGIGGILLVLLAIFAANLPFFTRRVLFVFPARDGEKSVAWRLLEVVLLYFVVGGFAQLLESRAGQVYRQDWEFYAVTFCLFLVFAYPGFVYRYLWNRPS